MKRGVIYLRVSTGKQVEGVSLDNQELGCQRWASSNNIAISRTFREEGASGKSLNRKALQELITYIYEYGDAIDYLIVYQWDRISRNLNSYIQLKEVLDKYSIEVRDVGSPLKSSAATRFTENIAVSFAQFDNEVKSERVLDNMRLLAKAGYRMHKAPYGLRNIRDYQNRPTLGPIHGVTHKLAKLLQEFSTGKYNITEIVKYARTLGLTTSTGKPISIQLMSKILRNPVYAGYEVSSLTEGRLVRTIFPGIIPIDNFERNQIILSRISGKRDYKTDREEYPLRRFVICNRCGTHITGSSSTGRNGKKYPRYNCRICKKSAVLIDTLHDSFTSELQTLSPSPEVSEYVKRIIIKAWNEEAKSYLVEKIRIEKRTNEISHKIQSALEKYIDGSITKDEKDSYTSALSKEMSELEEQKKRFSGVINDNTTIVDYAMSALANIAMLWKDSPLESKRTLQALIFPKGIKYDFTTNKFRTTLPSRLFRFADTKKDLSFEEKSLLVIPRRIELRFPD